MNVGREGERGRGREGEREDLKYKDEEMKVERENEREGGGEGGSVRGLRISLWHPEKRFPSPHGLSLKKARHPVHSDVNGVEALQGPLMTGVPPQDIGPSSQGNQR